MKRYIKSSATDRTFRNTRNPHKFIETRKYDDGHTVARQYMEWDTPDGKIKNYTGAKDAKRGRYFRARKDSLNSMLEDYEEIIDDYDVIDDYDEY